MSKERREDEFKRGIGDKAIAARRERAADKIDEKRLRRRFAVARGPAQQQEQSIQYDLNALVQHGNLVQLRLLSETVAQLMERDNGDLERALPGLIVIEGKPVAVYALVRFHDSHPDAAVRLAALGTLVNLTNTVDPTMALSICNAMARAGFLLKSYPEPEYWDAVINIALCCPAACEEIHASPLITEGHFSRALLTEASTTLNASFSSLSMRLQTLTFALLFSRNCPWSFARSVWPWLMRLISMLQPMPHKDLSQDQQLLRSSVLFSISLALRVAAGQQTINELLDPCFVPLLQQITYLVPHSSITDELHCMEIFVIISGASQNFQAAMEAVPGCIAYMIRSIQCNDSRLRSSAFLWLGNYVADGTAYVMRMIGDLGVMPILLHAIRMGEVNYPHVRRNAIHALMAMFESCYEEFKHDLATSARANEIMDKLVRGNRIFRHIVPFLSTGREVLDRAMTLNILSIMGDALRWNRAVTLEQLHDDGEAEGRVQVILASIKGGQDDELFYAAMAVEDLMEGRDPEKRMEIATDEAMAASVEGMGTDGVYQGGFVGGAGPMKYNF